MGKTYTYSAAPSSGELGLHGTKLGDIQIKQASASECDVILNCVDSQNPEGFGQGIRWFILNILLQNIVIHLLFFIFLAAQPPSIMALGKGHTWTLRNFLMCYMVSLGQTAMGYPSAIISVTLAQPSFLIYMGLLDLEANPPRLTDGNSVTRKSLSSVG